MNEALTAITLIWIFIYLYAILGSVDFGAGFWAMVYVNRDRGKEGVLANRFLSPSWEVTNVFLVLLVVSIYSFFPAAAHTLGTVLLIPASIILILLTFRSAFMVFSFTMKEYHSLLKYISGITGLLVPGLLVSILPVAAGGYIEIVNGTKQLMLPKLLSSPTEYAYLAFGIASELFLSALLLCDYSREADEEETYLSYRFHAIWLGPTTLIAAFLTVIFMAPEASWLRGNLMDNSNVFILSTIAFLIGYSALWWKPPNKGLFRGNPRVAVIAIVIQFGLATYAYGTAHLPYIIYPYVTVENGVTNYPMFRVLLISYIVGSLLLIPLFVYFWRLFMKDKSYIKQK